MLVYEIKTSKVSETRIYLDNNTKEVVMYQYNFKDNQIVDTNCIQISIQQFGLLTQNVLKSYLIQSITP